MTTVKGFRFENWPKSGEHRMNIDTMIFYYLVFRAREGDKLADELLRVCGWTVFYDADKKVIWSADKNGKNSPPAP